MITTPARARALIPLADGAPCRKRGPRAATPARVVRAPGGFARFDLLRLVRAGLRVAADLRGDSRRDWWKATRETGWKTATDSRAAALPCRATGWGSAPDAIRTETGSARAVPPVPVPAAAPQEPRAW